MGAEITGSFKDRIAQCKNAMRRIKNRRDAASVRKYQEAANKLNEIYNQKGNFLETEEQAIMAKGRGPE